MANRLPSLIVTNTHGLPQKLPNELGKTVPQYSQTQSWTTAPQFGQFAMSPTATDHPSST
jgi:hypothetical protein